MLEARCRLERGEVKAGVGLIVWGAFERGDGGVGVSGSPLPSSLCSMGRASTLGVTFLLLLAFYLRRGDLVATADEEAAEETRVAFARVEHHRLRAELLANQVEGLGHRFGAEGLYVHGDR